MYDHERHGNYSLLWPYVSTQTLRTAIDIGGHEGKWTSRWHERVEKIETFEPNPDILPTLKKNTNTLKNCTIHEVALGDTTGNVSMQYETHTGTCHITDYNGSINLRTLDSYNFQDVDIIKIDVEGFEVPVLQGAKQTILSQRPWIQIEGNSAGKRYGRSKLDILNLLHSWGMKRVVKLWPDQIWRF